MRTGAYPLSNRLPYHTEEANIIRSQVGSRNDNGEWVPGKDVVTGIAQSTAPITDKERELLPEGLRLSDVRKFWTDAPADTIRAGEADGDIIDYGNKKYRVIMIADWGDMREITSVAPESRN